MKRLKQVIHRYGQILIAVILIVHSLVLCGLTHNALQTAGTLRGISQELAIQRLSLKLGIPPDWQALVPYLEEVLREGMSREEVLAELNKVGPYIIEPEPGSNCEIVEFQLGPEKRTLYRMWFCFRYDEARSLRDYGVISD